MKTKSQGQRKYFTSFLCIYALFFIFINANPVNGSWTSRGPYGGYVNCIASAPSNPDIVFAGTVQGLFKSMDAGKSWSKTGFPEIYVRSLGVDPGNPTKVYAGTDAGIYKSTDGGASWNQQSLSKARVNTIAVDPDKTDTIYAGTGWPWSMKTNEIVGVYKSTDGGKTWQQMLSGDLDAVMTVLIDSRNSEYIYAGAYNESWGGGFYKSPDGGNTWENRNVSSGSWDKVVALAMTSGIVSPGVIFAIGEGPDVYKSENQGDIWTRCNVIATGFYQSYPLGLAVDPADPQTVYVSNWNRATTPFKGGIFKTTNGGGSWVGKTTGLPTSVVTSIVIDPRNSSLMIGLNEGGFYKSNDKADSWSSSNKNLLNTFIESLAVAPDSSKTLYAAVQGEYQLAKSINAGDSWQYLPNSPVELGAVAIDPQNSSTVWAGDGYQSGSQFYVYKSTDSGLTWESINFYTILGGGGATGVKEILIHPTCSDCLLVGSDFGLQNGSINGSGVLARTTNGGSSWQQLGSSTTALAFDPNNYDIVYMGKRRVGQVFRYGNVWNSASFTEITPLDEKGDRIIGAVTDIVVDSNSFVYVAAATGLWRWDGSDWKLFDNLSFDEVVALATDRTTSPETIYIGTAEDGIFFSQDGGSSWASFNEGLGALSIKNLAINGGPSKMLYAGTRYGGVWSRTIGKDVSGLVEAFVTRFYQLCLGRNPDPAGLEDWVNSLLKGSLTGSDVAYGFVFSPEFLNKNSSNEEYLQILYEAFFNRQPDEAGRQGWLDAMKNGASREQVLNGFIYAVEFSELCDEYGIKAYAGHFPRSQREPVEAFVTRFYQLCLDRNPDAAGLEGWTNNLLNQIQTGADVAKGFIFSPEFIGKGTDNEDYLTILYEAFFDRDPDQPGWDGWLSELNRGKDRGEVLDGFIYSTEFSNLCSEYGIKAF